MARRFCPPTSQQGLLEPDAGKLARPVLKGAGHSNVPGLPDRSATHDAARRLSAQTSLQSAPSRELGVGTEMLLMKEEQVSDDGTCAAWLRVKRSSLRRDA